MVFQYPPWLKCCSPDCTIRHAIIPEFFSKLFFANKPTTNEIVVQPVWRSRDALTPFTRPVDTGKCLLSGVSIGFSTKQARNGNAQPHSSFRVLLPSDSCWQQNRLASCTTWQLDNVSTRPPRQLDSRCGKTDEFDRIFNRYRIPLCVKLFWRLSLIHILLNLFWLILIRFFFLSTGWLETRFNEQIR